MLLVVIGYRQKGGVSKGRVGEILGLDASSILDDLLRQGLIYCDPSRELNFWRPTQSALLALGLRSHTDIPALKELEEWFDTQKKLLATASARLRQTEQPVKVGMTVTHKSYGAGKVVDEWRTIRSGVPCKDIFDVIFQNRSGCPFLHCCRKEYLTPDPLSLPSEDVATRPVRMRNAGRPALRRAPSPARICGKRNCRCG